MKYTLIIIALLFLSCNTSEEKKLANNTEVELANVPILNLEEANRLAELPLHCIETQYPNKLNQTIGSSDDLKAPKQLHPTFYGCFDWHSAVHGYWSLVSLLKQFPNLEKAEVIKSKLASNMSSKNILTEVEYLKANITNLMSGLMVGLGF